MMKGTIALVAGAVLVCAVPTAHAADYPTRPITLMIGFAPGGPSDVMARIITRKMEEILKQPLVIENRAGAGGSVAGSAVARAAPDGYTVLLATGSLLAINVSLYKNLGYDPEKDFEPITEVGTQTNVLYCHPTLPAQTLGELITYAKANPGKLSFGSGGNGTPAHLAGELLKIEAKIDMTHVPFRGTGPALQAVIGGHLPMAFNPPSPLLPHLQSGGDPRHRGDHPQAHRGAAGCADHRRARFPRLRRDHLARPGRPGGHAQGRGRHAPPRGGRRVERCGGAQGVDRSRRRRGRQFAGGVPRLHQVGNPEMGGGREGLGRQGGLTCTFSS
jgi:Tripartite tricarboxylate transporter family receptor